MTGFFTTVIDGRNGVGQKMPRASRLLVIFGDLVEAPEAWVKARLGLMLTKEGKTYESTRGRG